MDQLFCDAGSAGCQPILLMMRILVAAFLAILFLQSGLDKVFDREGNLSWLKGHFAKSPLKNLVSLNLTIITVLEVAAGAFSFLAIGQLILTGGIGLASIGFSLSALCILCLFFGQRLAKDYAGAASLVSYFILCLLGMYLVSH